MSELGKAEIEELAEFARLKLSEEECSALQKDLGGILTHIEQLAEVDTAHVPPMSHPNLSHTGLREDRVEPSLDRELLLGSAPKHEEGQFVVPAILPSSEDKSQ